MVVENVPADSQQGVFAGVGFLDDAAELADPLDGVGEHGFAGGLGGFLGVSRGGIEFVGVFSGLADNQFRDALGPGDQVSRVFRKAADRRDQFLELLMEGGPGINGGRLGLTLAQLRDGLLGGGQFLRQVRRFPHLMQRASHRVVDAPAGNQQKWTEHEEEDRHLDQRGRRASDACRTQHTHTELLGVQESGHY